MDELSTEEKKRRFLQQSKMLWMMEGISITDEELEQSISGIDFSESDEDSAVVVCYRRAKERAKTDSRDFVEIFKEEEAAFKLESSHKIE